MSAGGRTTDLSLSHGGEERAGGLGLPRRDFGLTGLEHREGLGEEGEPPDGDGGEQGWVGG